MTERMTDERIAEIEKLFPRRQYTHGGGIDWIRLSSELLTALKAERAECERLREEVTEYEAREYDRQISEQEQS